MTSLAVVAAPLLLAACGGGNGDERLTYDEIIDQGESLVRKYQSSSITAPLDMPVSGSATYDGVGAYSPFSSDPAGIIENATSVSQVQATVNFGTRDFTARAYNFQATPLVEDVDIAGSLNMDGAVAGNTFAGALSGTLTEDGVPVNYAGAVDGVFVGPDAQAMIGTGFADATSGGASLGRSYGVWIAEQ